MAEKLRSHIDELIGISIYRRFLKTTRFFKKPRHINGYTEF